MVKNTLLITTLVAFSLSGWLFADGSLLSQPEKQGALDLVNVFQSCPIIYSILLLLSVSATVLWIYSLFTLRINELMPSEFISTLRASISEKHYEEALEYCQREGNFASRIIASGLASRSHGSQVVMDAIQAEGRRLGNALWQRIALLNDIAAIAPMFGLLGTVLGLFFAFYDSSNAADNLTSIFDGLGIAVGTTVLGLIVAIMAMVFYTTLKYRVVTVLNEVENESLAIVSLIERDDSSRH